MTQSLQTTHFFTRDKQFYKTLLHLMVVVILQNIVAYSVNMADNLMLGAYSQEALSGAATVNQIQFMVQQMTNAIGGSVVVIGSQYWGQKKNEPICHLTGIALTFALFIGFSAFVWTSISPRSLLYIFTSNEAYISEGVRYLELIRFTYPIYVTTTILMASLRTVKTVNISLCVSIASLILDVAINYTLIFGRFGFPELGIYGAAVGTLAARITELAITLLYIAFRDKKLCLFKYNIFAYPKNLFKKFFTILLPSFISSVLWSLATPIQTAILGHLSTDAIAANSVSTTIYQYLKIITLGEASASSVLVGSTIGSGADDEKIREYTRTLQMIYIAVGLTLGTALLILRRPYLSNYSLSANAMDLADKIMLILVIIFIGMAYEMPTMSGIISGGGNVKYSMYVNSISTWCIVMPLSFLAAFVWDLPIVWIVAILNSDQVFKCIPIAIRVNRYKWIRRLTK